MTCFRRFCFRCFFILFIKAADHMNTVPCANISIIKHNARLWRPVSNISWIRIMNVTAVPQIKFAVKVSNFFFKTRRLCLREYKRKARDKILCRSAGIQMCPAYSSVHCNGDRRPFRTSCLIGNFRFVTACIPEILHYVLFRLHVSPLCQMLHEEALQLVKRYRTLSAASVMP